MKLNKGWQKGCIGIPGKLNGINAVQYYVKAGAEKAENGIEGGKVTGLILNANRKTLAFYSEYDGWVIKPDEECEAVMIALAICLKDFN